MRTKLSSIWGYVLFNIIIKDLHDLFRPGLLLEIESGIVNGTQVTEELMLVGGVLMELPMLMMLLTHFLPFKLSKSANISVAVIALLSTLINSPKDFDDMFFMIMITGGLLAVIFISWQWKESHEHSENSMV